MRDDLQIPLHGETIRRQTQVSDELLHVQPLGDFTRLAIDLYCQGLAHEVFLTDDGPGATWLAHSQEWLCHAGQGGSRGDEGAGLTGGLFSVRIF